MDLTAFQAAAETCLMWIGFGVVSGLAAKVLLPGRDPGGTLVTLLLGIGGALIGAAIYTWVTGNPLRHTISPGGFAVAVGGSLVLLLSHRILSGRLFGRRQAVIQEVVAAPPAWTRRRRRAARYSDLD